jgi:hypothetical protein
VPLKGDIRDVRLVRHWLMLLASEDDDGRRGLEIDGVKSEED